jgi:molybdopterin-guanine dinucleotide biosynthesis protein
MVRTIVAIGGFSSEVGKTTLLCELLGALPGWEAIKLTRGHYRSCGKDPHACCVSHLLGDQPLIRSGRRETYATGKDTGRYWDAGASNVHWVIGTDDQVEQGIKMALERTSAPGVLIEGNSFLKYVDVDFGLMVSKADGGKIKPTARRALNNFNAIYLFDDANGTTTDARERFQGWLESSNDREVLARLPVYTRDDLPQLIERIGEVHQIRSNIGSREPAERGFAERI